jgi:hypothetical protein
MPGDADGVRLSLKSVRAGDGCTLVSRLRQMLGVLKLTVLNFKLTVLALKLTALIL